MVKLVRTPFLMEKIFGKADLHIHSNYSHDAFSPVRGILEIADKKNLDLIAITDHDTIKGAEEAKKIESEFRVKVIKGQEVGTKDGHLVAIFIEKFIFPQRPILNTIREIHKQGGLVIVPHPFAPFSLGVSEETIFKIYKEVEGIEVFNGSLMGWIHRGKAKKLNSEIFNLAPIASSDAHVLSQVGMGYTVFNGKSPSDLYFSIKNKLTRPENCFNFLSYFELILKQPERTIKKLFRNKTR